MNNELIRARATLERTVATMQEHSAAAEEMNNAIVLPEGIGVGISEYSINFHIPFDPALIRAFRLALGSRLRRLSSRQDDDGDVCWEAVWTKGDGKTVRVIVWLLATRSGATCQRVEVGKKAVPVYKIVCGQVPT